MLLVYGWNVSSPILVWYTEIKRSSQDLKDQSLVYVTTSSQSLENAKEPMQLSHVCVALEKFLLHNVANLIKELQLILCHFTIMFDQLDLQV